MENTATATAETSEAESMIVRYLPYLYEIRKRLLFVFSLFILAWIVGFIYYKQIVLFILRLYDLNGVNLAFTSPFQFLNLAINAGMVVALVVVLPLLVFQITAFLKPALLKKEYNLLLALVPFSFLLFTLGFGFGTWMMKFVVKIFSTQTGEFAIQNLWDISEFLSQIFLTSMLLGILFQFPLVMTFLIRLGIVTHKTLSKQRLLIHAALVGLAILMPPTDLLSLFFMIAPLAFLFELTLLLNRNQNGKLALDKVI